jgi:hypothetical protein
MRLLGKLRVIELCYRYAYLDRKARLGRQLPSRDRLQLLTLRAVLEESPKHRRGHRRFPLDITALVRMGKWSCSGTVLDVSATGLKVQVDEEVQVGAPVQVRCGMPGRLEYVFTCKAVRQEPLEGGAILGLRYACVPLEMRSGAITTIAAPG